MPLVGMNCRPAVLRRRASRPQLKRDPLDGAIMARRDGQGTCEHCSSAFDYYLVHNGFNGSSYAYCESCGRTALLYRPEWPLAISIPFHYEMASWVEEQLPPCICGGRFRPDGAPRCPKCNATLSANEATRWLEAQAVGTSEGWRWQRSWQGLYCIVIDGRVIEYAWEQGSPRRLTSA